MQKLSPISPEYDFPFHPILYLGQFRLDQIIDEKSSVITIDRSSKCLVP